MTRKVGRPTKDPREGTRVSLGLRVTPEVKRKLVSAATTTGRSLSQEVEFRLETSLAEEKMMDAMLGVLLRIEDALRTLKMKGWQL